MPDLPVLVDVDAGLAHVRLNNPAHGNVLDLPMILGLEDALVGLAAHNPRAVFISAEGSKFCVGGDLNGMHAAIDRAELLDAMARPFHRGLLALEELGVPVIVAVNGAAAGGGLSLVLAGDIVIGSESSSYMMAYTAIGLSADGGSSFRLPRLVGLRLAQEMAFLGRQLDAREAFAAGLVTRLVPERALHDEAVAIARRLATGPTGAYIKMKRLIGRSFASGLSEQLDAETEAITDCAATYDCGEGISAFLGRREPQFRGN